MATPPAVLAVMRAARIICRTPRDAVMFAVHCTFMAEGYVLLAAGDNVDPMMFQTKEEEPDDGLPKRRPDPHLGWNDMEDEYAFKYCALGDYDNLGGKPRRGRYSGAILKAMHVGNTLMVHAVRTEDGVRSETLASAEFTLATHAKDADEVTLAADPSLALANVADLVAATRSSLIDPITPPNKEDEAKGDDEGERAKTGTSSAAAGGEGEKASGGGEAGRGGEGGGDLNMDGNPFRRYPPHRPPGARFDPPHGPVPGMGPMGPVVPVVGGFFEGDPRFAPGRGPPEIIDPDVDFGGVPDGFYPVPGPGGVGIGGPRGPPGWPGTGGAPRWNPDLGPPPEG